MKTLLNFIGGNLIPPIEDKWLESINPATGAAFAQVPASTELDLQQALDAASMAFPLWSGLSHEQRAAYLFKIADMIEKNIEMLARAESEDNGKPMALARSVDIPRSALNCRFFASGLMHFSSESHYQPGFLNYTLRQPLGVGACISPWNLPLYLFTWKIMPALAAGNTVVAKPSEITPLTAYLFSELLQKVGLPAGVLNIVHGTGPDIGAPLVVAPEVKAISFTGSTKTGSLIAGSVAPHFKKTALEMGGKNAALVFADCNFDQMINTILRSAFANQGQICLCTSRILIERSIYSDFKETFVKRVKAMKVGDPLLPETNLGAVVSKTHQEKILSYIKLAVTEGGQILCGGQAIKPEGRCQDGFFVAPTVIEGLGPGCRCNQEEIFGPVVTLQVFEDESEALALANASTYGLAASIWTSDIHRAQRLSEQVQAGIVWVNTWMHRDLRTPFGGMGHSGVGREGGWEAFRFWTEPKNVCIAH